MGYRILTVLLRNRTGLNIFGGFFWGGGGGEGGRLPFSVVQYGSDEELRIFCEGKVGIARRLYRKASCRTL
jgi:hypothetical protein